MAWHGMAWHGMVPVFEWLSTSSSTSTFFPLFCDFFFTLSSTPARAKLFDECKRGENSMRK
jgi:hypothetical protein